MRAREQDIPALKRFISSIFVTEQEHSEELTAIAHDPALTESERADKYLDCIISYLEFVPDLTEEKK